MDFMTWYQGLAKPDWTPDPATIGLVWQILYPIIFVTFAFMLVQAVRTLGGHRPGAVPDLGVDRDRAAALDHLDEPLTRPDRARKAPRPPVAFGFWRFGRPRVRS